MNAVAERETTTFTTMSRRRGRVVAVVGAVLAATMLGLVVRLAGLDTEIAMAGQPAMELGLSAVVLTALVASLAGWASLAILERLTTRARAWWTVLAVVALLASFVPVLAIDASAEARIGLAVLHVVVAAVLVPGLRRTT